MEVLISFYNYLIKITVFVQSAENYSRSHCKRINLDEIFPSEHVRAAWAYVHGVFAGVDAKRADANEAT